MIKINKLQSKKKLSKMKLSKMIQVKIFVMTNSILEFKTLKPSESLVKIHIIRFKT